MSSSQSTVFIRRATAEDSPAVSHICLVTADAGESAEALHKAGELPGLVYAEPYVHLPDAFGFVMVDSTKTQNRYGGVVGYVLSTYDTRAFEKSMKDQYLPAYLEKYPLSALDAEPTPDTSSHLLDLAPKDKQYIRTIHNLPSAPDVNVAFSPVHLHIDILAEYQRQGWGRRLIGEVVRHLKEEGRADRLWLGLDTRNVNAKKFYHRLGFREIPNAADGVMGLKFEDWQDKER